MSNFSLFSPKDLSDLVFYFYMIGEVWLIKWTYTTLLLCYIFLFVSYWYFSLLMNVVVSTTPKSHNYFIVDLRAISILPSLFKVCERVVQPGDWFKICIAFIFCLKCNLNFVMVMIVPLLSGMYQTIITNDEKMILFLLHFSKLLTLSIIKFYF